MAAAARPLRDRVAGLGHLRAPARSGRARQPLDRLLAFGRSRLETTLRARRPDPGRPGGRRRAQLRGVLLRRDARALPARRARRDRRPRRCWRSRCWRRWRCRSSTSRCTIEGIHGRPDLRRLGRPRAPDHPALIAAAGAQALPAGAAPKVSPSTSAPHDASMTLAPDADGDPRRLAVGGLDEHPGDRVGAVALVEDAHLVVDQLELRDLRVGLPDRLAQRLVERVDRAVALAGDDVRARRRRAASRSPRRPPRSPRLRASR